MFYVSNIINVGKYALDVSMLNMLIERLWIQNMLIDRWVMAYLYEYYSLLIPAEFLTNALYAKLERMSTPNRWYMRFTGRQKLVDGSIWPRANLNTSPKILDKHIERESVT